MRTFRIPSTARQVLWFVFNAGAPVIVLSAVVLVPILTGVACPSGASASTRAAAQSGADGPAGYLGPTRLSRILGSTAYAADHKRIGTVDDVLLDTKGRVTAVTLSVGAFLGVHTRTLAVPIENVRLVSRTDAPDRPDPSAALAGISDDGSTLMEELMSRSERAWLPNAVDHIEVSFTWKELEGFPSYTSD